MAIAILVKNKSQFDYFAKSSNRQKIIYPRYSLGCDSLSLLWRELVDSEFRLSVLGTEDSSEVSMASTSSGVTDHWVRRLWRTASQPCCFSTSQPCRVLEITPSTYTHVLHTHRRTHTHTHTHTPIYSDVCSGGSGWETKPGTNPSHMLYDPFL